MNIQKKKEEVKKEPELDEEEKKKRDEMKDFRNYLTKVILDLINFTSYNHYICIGS